MDEQIQSPEVILVEIAARLAAFDALEPTFVASFQFVQEVQGLRRFPTFPVASTVRYLYALLVCEEKDRLLGVPRTPAQDRYEGEVCLDLLQHWQEAGESAEVVAFLQRKLDALPFASVTRAYEAARRDPTPAGQAQAARLAHGRLVLLWRGMNLHQALEPLFMLPEEELVGQVHAACAQYGLTPDQIEEHRRALASPLYAIGVRHPALARRNMQVMNRQWAQVTSDVPDWPGHRSWRVLAPVATMAASGSPAPGEPYAEQVILGYVALTAPLHNNPAGVRFWDRPEPVARPNTVRTEE
jgi:hypothetical protein